MAHSKYKTKIKSEILKYMVDNYNKSNGIKKFCDKLLIDVQKEFVKDPPVYMTILKDTRSDVEERYYLTAKTMFPVGINKTKEIRLYVGTLEEFPNGTKDVRGKIVGKRKLIERLSTMVK